VAIPSDASGSVYPSFPFFTEANDAIGFELEKVMLGELTVEEGLEAADTASLRSLLLSTWRIARRSSRPTVKCEGARWSALTSGLPQSIGN